MESVKNLYHCKWIILSCTIIMSIGNIPYLCALIESDIITDTSDSTDTNIVI